MRPVVQPLHFPVLLLQFVMVTNLLVKARSLPALCCLQRNMPISGTAFNFKDINQIIQDKNGRRISLWGRSARLSDPTWPTELTLPLHWFDCLQQESSSASREKIQHQTVTGFNTPQSGAGYNAYPPLGHAPCPGRVIVPLAALLTNQPWQMVRRLK